MTRRSTLYFFLVLCPSEFFFEGLSLLRLSFDSKIPEGGAEGLDRITLRPTSDQEQNLSVPRKKKKNNLKNVFLFFERTVNGVNDIHKIIAEKELFEKILLLQTTADKPRQTRDTTAHVSRMNVCVRTLTITLGAARPVS